MNQTPEVSLEQCCNLVRWLTVPMMSTAAVFSILTDESFRWSDGPYGTLFGSWFLGYAIWAGQSTMAKAVAGRRFPIASGRWETRDKLHTAVDSYRWDKPAKIELAVAIVILSTVCFLPDTGFAIVAFTVLHMAFVVGWRTYFGRVRDEVAT